MRLHLTLALLTAILLAVTLYYTKNARHTFGYQQVQQLAEKLAQEKYKAPQDVLPPQLKKLTPEQERGIFWKDTARLWRSKGYPFQVDFYHQLKSNPLPHAALPLYYVDQKGAHPVPYSPLFFNYNNLSFDSPLPADLGYAGFYLRYPINKPESLDGFFSVMGSNYFRVLAKDQVYGLSARALALNTSANKKTEEFPNWVGWWLHEPTTTSTQLVMDALMDSPSVTGEYEFKIQPGAMTTVHVHATLFFRQTVDQIGIAPFSSMYLFGENAKDHFGDNVHPEIHDSDGVLMQRNSGEWVWRPLEQSPMLQIYAFPDENPRGFGLIQRDRDFNHYQDLNNKYNVRPSAWVTPQGNWGKGAFTLTQLPTNNTDTDNVVLFWAPEQAPKAGDRMELNYTIDFYMNDAERPPLAYTRETLINCPAPPPAPASIAPPPAPTGKPTPPAPPAPPPPPPKPGDTVPVQFVVDFVGHGIEDIPAELTPDLDLVALPPGTVIRDRKVEKNSYDHSWKVTFTIIPLKHNVPTELICRLNSRGKPLTETWTYTWHQ